MTVRNKPGTRQAMEQLIEQVREVVPFDIPQEQLCSGTCRGCPKKLLEYLDMELTDWSDRLDDGAPPLLGDVDRLAKTAKKIVKALERNQIL